MKKQTQKKRKISKKKLLDKQRIQYTIQDILLEKLDSEIRGFRDIRWEKFKGI